MKDRNDIRKEVLDALRPFPHGRIIAAPRIGKTAIAIDIIKRDKPKRILWVTPSAELAETGIKSEFIKWKATKYLERLVTTTYAYLPKIEDEFETIILDEEQFVTENNMYSILEKKIKYRNIISMTGTKTKIYEKYELFNKLNLKILYEIDINTAVDMGLLSNYVIKVVNVPMSFHKDMYVGKEHQFLTSEINNYKRLNKAVDNGIITNDPNLKFKILARMRAIYDSPSKERTMMYLKERLEGRKMYFCGSIAQAERICEHRYHSKTNNKDLLDFINGDINEISMVNSGTVGFTYKAVDHLIISQVNSDNTGSTTQKICRVLLKQKNYDAVIWILCLKDTKDEKWVKSALENFDENRIEYLEYGKF